MRPPILLIEDDLALAEALMASLLNVGVPAEHCASAEVAVEWVRENSYPLAVIDIVLGDGPSGLYVVNAIRRLPAGRRPEVVIITGSKIEALRGVDRSVVTAILLKPLDFELFAGYVGVTYEHAIRGQADRSARMGPTR